MFRAISFAFLLLTLVGCDAIEGGPAAWGDGQSKEEAAAQEVSPVPEVEFPPPGTIGTLDSEE